MQKLDLGEELGNTVAVWPHESLTNTLHISWKQILESLSGQHIAKAGSDGTVLVLYWISLRLIRVRVNCIKISICISAAIAKKDEHHAIIDCSAYTDAREQYCDLFQSHITTVGDLPNQPQSNRLAKFLTWIRMLRMNRA